MTVEQESKKCKCKYCHKITEVKWVGERTFCNKGCFNNYLIKQREDKVRKYAKGFAKSINKNNDENTLMNFGILGLQTPLEVYLAFYNELVRGVK